ncbi:flagellar hook-length control protein FliK [Cupriavidus sp. NPDC089707]|uniref:flagellar hook-length control protein FliK n=1 Tax=Cupriavidus sp. NPDC089707 TaxID=3363963 RepID=UPI003823C621
MIDISQIVSNTANAAKAAGSAAESVKRASGDTSGFGDVLTRARESSPQQVPASRARDTDAGQEKSASHKQAAPEPARADTGKPQAAPAGKTDTADKAKEDDDSTVAADAAAAAAALALLLPATATASSAAAGAATAAVGSAADAGSSAALQAALAGAAQPAAADTADLASAPAPALRGDTALPGTLQVVTAEAKPAQPSAADTLATIASQRAAMQGGAPAATDARSAAALAQSVPAAGMPAQQDNAGQQPDGGVGQHRADPLAAANGTGNATGDGRPAATLFAAAQAAARATEATTASASAADTPALAATLAAQQTAQAPAAAAAAAARATVTPALYDSQWPQALGQQMIRLSTQGAQSAELQLNPPDLGPLKVVLNVVNDQAQAQFVSPHQAVRAAVEAALPHLRTALSENGIQLGQTSIGADGFAGQAGNGQQQQQAPGNGRGQAAFGTGTLAGTETSAPAEPVVRSTRVLARGEIDTFA